MRITSTTVRLHDPDAGGAALAELLGLPVEPDEQGPRIRVGWTDVRPTRASGDGVDHLAVLVPGDAVAAARAWLLARTAPLAVDVAGPPGWGSTSAYFDGPDGLVLELIAHEGHRPAGGTAFGPGSLLGVCEVGIAAPDVPAAAAATGLPPFGGNVPAFAPVGDRDGRLILVPPGRTWFPTRDRVAGLAPLAVTAEAGRAADLRVGDAAVRLR